jgi:hypothetical protein
MRLPERTRRRTVIASALASAFILIGGVVAGFAIGGIVNESLPGHSTDPINIAMSMVAALAGVGAGGAAWGSAISRITRAGDRARMAWAGAIGFAPTVLLVALALSFLENLIVEQGHGPDLPIHRVFTMLFVPAAAIVTGAGGFALGFGSRAGATRASLAAGARLAVWCALAGGITFLAVNLTLDALGFRVGAPGALERATMVTTALLGNLSAALVAGGVIGRTLARTAPRPSVARASGE